MIVDLLVQPWFCHICIVTVKPLLGITVINSKDERTVYCFKCWEGYVNKEYDFSGLYIVNKEAT